MKNAKGNNKKGSFIWVKNCQLCLSVELKNENKLIQKKRVNTM